MIIDFLKVYYLQILMMSPFLGVTIYGILTNINKFLKKIRCTETITGTITSVRKVSRNTNGGGRGRRNIVINKPTCTYMYDGVTYEREIDDSIGITDEKIGDKYEFKINPNRPKEAMNYYINDKIGMFLQLPLYFFILLVLCSSINNSYNKYVNQTKMAASTNETKKYLDGNQSGKDTNKDTNKDITKDDVTEKVYPDNMQKYTLNNVELWLDKEYYVNQDKQDVIVAKSPDKKVMFYMIVKTHNADVDTVMKQLKNNILKNNPNSEWMSMRKYGNNEFEIFSDKIDKCYVRYAVSANTSRKILIKYMYVDLNDEGFDSLLETITYQ